MKMKARANVLIVDDDPDIIDLVRASLRAQGYAVVSAREGESALALARKLKPDIALLDIGLPGMDGLELLRQLRQVSSVPIIFLTSQSGEIERVVGLKLGADDYVVKPFSLKELAARVEAVLRRRAPRASDGGTPKAVVVGGIEADFDRHEVRVKGRAVELAPKEFELLKILIEAQGKVLSRDLLRERIWGHTKDMDISTRTVDQHIARLRRKLKTAGRRIVTVPRFGYRVA